MQEARAAGMAGLLAASLGVLMVAAGEAVPQARGTVKEVAS